MRIVLFWCEVNYGKEDVFAPADDGNFLSVYT